MYKNRKKLKEEGFASASRCVTKYGEDSEVFSENVYIKYMDDTDSIDSIVVFVKPTKRKGESQYVLGLGKFDSFESIAHTFSEITTGYNDVPAKDKKIIYSELSNNLYTTSGSKKA